LPPTIRPTVRGLRADCGLHVLHFKRPPRLDVDRATDAALLEVGLRRLEDLDLADDV
jgi:hypothetical protein